MDNGPIKTPLPEHMAVLPVRNIVVFPGMTTQLLVGREASIELVNKAAADNQPVALVLQRRVEEEDPKPEDLFDIGTAVAIYRMQRLPEGQLRVLVRGLGKVKLAEVIRQDPYLVARTVPVADGVNGRDQEKEAALVATVLQLFQKMVSLSPNLSDELNVAALNLDRDPVQLCGFIASGLDIPLKEKQELLEETSVQLQLERLVLVLTKEISVLEAGNQIQDQVRQEVGQAQREHYLREQLRAIQKELGQGEDDEIALLRQRLDKASLPPEARKEAERELERLVQMPAAAAEYGVIRTYLDWMISLPWEKRSKERIDLKRARKILDQDHQGLDKVKERVLEYLAVRRLNPEQPGPIFCFVGPPGVGKTSLGRSIARTLGRKLVRIALGGVRDEAEIRGHRRTYVGALPGRIIQSLKKAGANNPVILLDEIDKVGADFRGDPAAALLEVLDPEQNMAFTDHYLDVPFDLSGAIFIATANQLETIPPALRDRLEVIQISSYTEEEKVKIARTHLLPRQLKSHGLQRRRILLDDDVLATVVQRYTREAGVRNLERELSTLCRKIALQVVSGRKGAFRIDKDALKALLGPERVRRSELEEAKIPGVVAGLAWTPVGGEIMHIEATRMKGDKQLILTGQLGDVMKESAQIALSHVRTRVSDWDIDQDFFSGSDIHIHFPAGAIPKDGPSAGVATATALLSLLSGQAVRKDVAMTGEVTLSGRVLAVGGIKEKVLAAARAGIKRVILPRQNEADLDDVPAEVREALSFVLVDEISEVFAASFDAQVMRKAA